MVYAKEFGWTPAQVDELPLGVEPFLLPIYNAILEYENERQEKAAAAAREAAKNKRQ